MSSRSDAWRCAALVVFVLAPLVTSEQPATTPWGDPDLQGIWTNFDLGEGYSLEAPVPFGGRPARLLGGTGTCNPSREPLPEVSSDAPIFVIPDHLFETATDTGKVRPSLISEPPDGRLPPLTEAGDRRIDSICPKAFESYVYLDPLGALHHARHPGLGVSVALQQRLSDTAGSGIRRHPLRNDS